MRTLILSLVVILAGCGTTATPVARKFPEAVPELQVKCPTLNTIEGKDVSITDMLKTVVNNYGLYYACSNKVDGWNEWYDKQRKNFDSVK